MKQLLLSILIIYSISCFSQEPNPDLFQTWYLYSLAPSDGMVPLVVSEIEPAITPSLTIMEDLTYIGTSACNTFNGTVILPDGVEVIYPDQYSTSTNECVAESHNFFEYVYFHFMQFLGGYTISSEENGLILTIYTSTHGVNVFKNFPLNISKFDLNQIEIYPNPASSIIYLKSKVNLIIKIELFNSLGQSIKIIESNFNTIDIKDLSNGFYIMKIDTEFGILNKRIIKK